MVCRHEPYTIFKENQPWQTKKTQYKKGTAMYSNYNTIRVKIDNGVAQLKLDNPPVNQLSAVLRQEMEEVFAIVESDDSVKAVVLTGTGKNFMAGADITEIQDIDDPDLLFEKVLAFDEFYNRIENSPKPVVAAINGPALGGGLELAMACHYRIGAVGITLGQPEVQLGLIPGAGGTQRLPRLCGFADAVNLITTGNMLKADQALEKGILDQVAEPGTLTEEAVRAARAFVSGEKNLAASITSQRTDRLPTPEEKAQIISFARGMAEKKARGMVAPFKALEALEKGLTGDFKADIALEAKLFCECAVSNIAKNLIRIFLNSRSAGRLPALKGVTPEKIKTVAMLGLGVMGSGIANLLLRKGFKAILWEKEPQALEKGIQSIRKTFAYPIKKGKMTQEDLDALIAEKALCTTNINDLAGADLVIEAVVENMDIKKEVWQQVDKICSDKAIFATNTSALPIARLATCLKDPSRMLGLHFFNPAERMQLVEIINAESTSKTALATGVAFCRAIGKIPVKVNDGPGFYVSRQLNALMGECNFMLEEGVPIPEVDRAMQSLGMPMGPFTLHDLTGIDIGYLVAKNFEKSFGERWQVSELHRRIYETGCFGRKTGSGYYEYTNGNAPSPNPRVTQTISDYLGEQGKGENSQESKALQERMLARAINEAAIMMEEGICDNPGDMDLAMVYGCGFPPHKGGILSAADHWKIKNVCQRLKQLEAEHGVRFTPSPRLMEMAEAGQGFYDARA